MRCTGIRVSAHEGRRTKKCAVGKVCQGKIGREVVRPERFELPAFWFVARRSIQLS